MGGDRALTAPMIVGAAVGVVVACAVLFALVGAIRGGDDPSNPVIAGGESPSAAATESVGDDAEEGTAGETATEEAPSDGDATTAAETEAASPAAEATEQSAAEDEAADDEADEPAEEDPASQVDPGEISIQVLDAVGRDGGAAARATADELRSAGYNVVVINGSSRSYTVTTVFWSEGQGPGGRAVAATLGTSEARRTPAEVRLSDSVDVHVVVGSDRA